MTCPLFNLFAKCTCAGGCICLYCIELTIAVCAVILGALIAWLPRKTIDMQIAVYRAINWKLEPVSMEKEVRNTRIMGSVLAIIGIATILVLLRWA